MGIAHQWAALGTERGAGSPPARPYRRCPGSLWRVYRNQHWPALCQRRWRRSLADHRRLSAFYLLRLGHRAQIRAVEETCPARTSSVYAVSAGEEVPPHILISRIGSIPSAAASRRLLAARHTAALAAPGRRRAPAARYAAPAQDRGLGARTRRRLPSASGEQPPGRTALAVTCRSLCLPVNNQAPSID